MTTSVSFSEKKTTNIKPLEPQSLIQYIKGVGPRLAEVLAKKGLLTVEDLVCYHPRAYRDQRAVDHFSQLIPDSYVTLYGYIENKRTIRTKWNKTFYEMWVSTKAGDIVCKYFRLPYYGYFDNLEIGQKIKMSGQVKFFRDRPEFHHPDIYPFKEDEDDDTSLLPIYSEIEKISQRKLRTIIATALEGLKKNPEFSSYDPLPAWLKKQKNLISKIEALERIHCPLKEEKAEDYLQFRSPALKRLIFEEFFFLQLYMNKRKFGWKKEKAPAIPFCCGLSDSLKKALPFSLTNAQQEALKDIYQDMRKPHPMHRLIQGDVGSGKTIVALLACAPVIEKGFQCAIMAPTEILAEQHYRNAFSLLTPLGVNIALLTGKTSVRKKRQIQEGLALGNISLCIGTHALIQGPVQFKNPALMIVDEQHRFGAHQRALLQKKSQEGEKKSQDDDFSSSSAFKFQPHFLVMTATPIPRSLAMTVYGDLDVSLIDELPGGRRAIVTQRIQAQEKDKVWSLLESKVQEGRQAYIVYPLVEESEYVDLKNAQEEYEKLKQRFPSFNLGLLHGRLPLDEKQEVMSHFYQGKIQILVSTTVIEVGVDVPNAVLMIVEHAERFGLSQLHQLRGRVGRGEHQSYCFLLQEGFSDTAYARLSIMERTRDGFKIAEEDLKIRGPGEFLGARQSGLAEFKTANIVRDGILLKEARSSARKILEKDPELNLPEHQALKETLKILSQKFLPG